MHGLVTCLLYFAHTPYPREVTKRHCHMPKKNFFMIHKLRWGSFLLPSTRLVSSWSIHPFGHNRHRPKIGALTLFGRAGSPSNTIWPGRSLSPCQVASWSIQPFDHNTPTSQTGQDSNSTGRTVCRTLLQTVAQKLIFHQYVTVSGKQCKINRHSNCGTQVECHVW